jgi:hypothetical protein
MRRTLLLSLLLIPALVWCSGCAPTCQVAPLAAETPAPGMARIEFARSWELPGLHVVAYVIDRGTGDLQHNAWLVDDAYGRKSAADESYMPRNYSSISGHSKSNMSVPDFLWGDYVGLKLGTLGLEGTIMPAGSDTPSTIQTYWVGSSGQVYGTSRPEGLPVQYIGQVANGSKLVWDRPPGDMVLHVVFTGNGPFQGISQKIPVEAGKTYRIKFGHSWKWVFDVSADR